MVEVNMDDLMKSHEERLSKMTPEERETYDKELEQVHAKDVMFIRNFDEVRGNSKVKVCLIGPYFHLFDCQGRPIYFIKQSSITTSSETAGSTGAIWVNATLKCEVLTEDQILELQVKNGLK